jgi:hypothetical protein
MTVAVVTITAAGQTALLQRDLVNLPVALRHCPDCGRLVAWRYGEMDEHISNGRGENCKTSLSRIRRDA